MKKKPTQYSLLQISVLPSLWLPQALQLLLRALPCLFLLGGTISTATSLESWVSNLSPNYASVKELTAGDYVDFLNVTAQEGDAYSFYNPLMENDPTVAVITQKTQEDGRYYYQVTEQQRDLPAPYLSRYQEECFVNWLEKGSPTEFDSTEDFEATLFSGVYQVGSASSGRDTPSQDSFYLLAEDGVSQNNLANNNDPNLVSDVTSCYILLNDRKGEGTAPLLLSKASTQPTRKWWEYPKDFGEACLYSMSIYAVSAVCTPIIKRRIVEPVNERVLYYGGDFRAFATQSTGSLESFSTNIEEPKELTIQSIQDQHRLNLTPFSLDQRETMNKRLGIREPEDFALTEVPSLLEEQIHPTSPSTETHKVHSWSSIQDLPHRGYHSSDPATEGDAFLKEEGRVGNWNSGYTKFPSIKDVEKNLITKRRTPPDSSPTDTVSNRRLEKYALRYTALIHIYYHDYLHQYLSRAGKWSWSETLGPIIPCLTTQKDRAIYLEEMRNIAKLIKEWMPDVQNGFEKAEEKNPHDLYRLTRYYASSLKSTREGNRSTARYYTQLGDTVHQAMLSYQSRYRYVTSPETGKAENNTEFSEKIVEAYNKAYEQFQKAEESLLRGNKEEYLFHYAFGKNYNVYAQKLRRVLESTPIASRFSYFEQIWQMNNIFPWLRKPPMTPSQEEEMKKIIYQQLEEEAHDYRDIYIEPRLIEEGGMRSNEMAAPESSSEHLVNKQRLSGAEAGAGLIEGDEPHFGVH